MRRAALAALVLALAGCGSAKHRPPAQATPTATPRPRTDRERIGTLLARRARALGAGRVRAFAATSLPARREAALLGGRRADGLGLVRPHYVVERIAVHGRRARVRARLAYGVEGVRGDFGTARTLLLRKRRGAWRVDRALGTRDAEPWEIDDYVRAESPHFVILVPDDLVPPEDALEAGYARLREALRNSHLRRRYLAVVARDGEHATQLTRAIQGVGTLTALTDTQIGTGRRIASQRLILVQTLFGAQTAEDQQTVVTHELTHAVLAPFATGRTPAWLIEGIALYVSGDDRRAEYATLTTVPTLAGLSTPEAITRLTGDQQRAAYATSSAAAFLIADRYGRDALLSLYRAFARPGPRRGGAAYDDRILRRVLGTGIDALQRTLG